MPASDEMLPAIERFVAALDANCKGWDDVRERMQALLAAARAGQRYSDAYELLLGNGPGPNLLEMVTENQEALIAAAAQLRRSMARQLRAEGMSVIGVAKAMGVTRQRVYQMLSATD